MILEIDANMSSKRIDNSDRGILISTKIEGTLFGVLFSQILPIGVRTTGSVSASISFYDPKLVIEKIPEGFDILFTYALVEYFVRIGGGGGPYTASRGGNIHVIREIRDELPHQINFLFTINNPYQADFYLPVSWETEIQVSYLGNEIESPLIPIMDLSGDHIYDMSACVPASTYISTLNGNIKIIDLDKKTRFQNHLGNEIEILGVAVFPCDGNYKVLRKDNQVLYIKSGHPIWIGGEIKLAGKLSREIINLGTRETYSLVTEKPTYVLMNGFYVGTWGQKALERSRKIYRLL